MQKTCTVTGKQFEVSQKEMELRKKMKIEGEPSTHPMVRMRHLMAFWQHWNLYRRKCDRTGKQIISVFSEECPYPVWHKDEWMKHANPPLADVNLSAPVIPQMWELFKQCPIAHNIGAGCENCEYTDDWWFSKNCYLSHSGFETEDLSYCYRVVHCKNCQFCVFSFDSERCIDLINCHNCNEVRYAFNSNNCSDSAFLYDCRNCTHCLFCFNLRNKRFCIGNKQLTKEEYEKQAAELNMQSRTEYLAAKDTFNQMLRSQAWHRALFIDRSEDSTGNHMDECKGMVNSFFATNGAEDCVNCIRGAKEVKDCLDIVSPLRVQLGYCSVLTQEQCYEVKFCYNISQCNRVEYLAHCVQCEDCFACCGLKGKKYHIFNKPYSQEEYEILRTKIIQAMKDHGEYGAFFPGYFAANSYADSLAATYWKLTPEETLRAGFRVENQTTARSSNVKDAAEVPDNSADATDAVTKEVFWDAEAGRQFQILAQDIAFAKSIGAPLPYNFYSHRLQENFSNIYFNGELRTTACGKCQAEIKTGWPAQFDGRILCEQCYLVQVY